MLVGEHLKLNVAWSPKEFFDVNIRATECRGGFLLRLHQQRGQFRGNVHHAHAAPTPACRSFQNDRVADRLRGGERFLFGFDDAVRAGKNGHARIAHQGPRPFFHAHELDDVWLRPDEFQAGLMADVGETRILAEETIAGMNSLDIGDFRRADDGRNIEVAARALGGTDANGFVGETNGQAVAIGFRVNRHGGNAEVLTRADDAQRDLSPVGYENFLKGGGSQTGPLHTRQADRWAPICSRSCRRSRPRSRSSISWIR